MQIDTQFPLFARYTASNVRVSRNSHYVRCYLSFARNVLFDGAVTWLLFDFTLHAHVTHRSTRVLLANNPTFIHLNVPPLPSFHSLSQANKVQVCKAVGKKEEKQRER